MSTSSSLAGITITLFRQPLLPTDRVAQRFGVESTVRPVVQQGLAALDALADRVSPPERRTTFTHDEPAPAPASAPASAPALASGEASAPAPAEADDEELIEHVAEELLDEEALAPRAGELAEDDELRRV